MEMDQVFDAQVLQEWKKIAPDHWQSMVLSILEVFFATVPGQFEELSASIRAGDAKRARAIAHKLKSACGNVGAMSGLRILDEMEKAGDGEIEKMGNLMVSFDLIYRLQMEAITNFRQGLKAA